MNSAMGHVMQVVVHLTLVLVAFNVGLHAGGADAAHLARRRALLVRALVGTLLIVPILAVLWVKLLVPSAAVATGIIAMAIAIGPVSAIARTTSTSEGRRAVAVHLTIILLVSSLVFVPLAAWVIGSLFQREVHVSVASIARTIIPLQFFPLVGGIILARRAPDLAARIIKPLAIGAHVALMAVVLLVVLLFFRPMLALGARAHATLACFALSAILAAHLLAGRNTGDRRVLAAFMALRFPALALAVTSASIQGKQAVPSVLAYAVASVLAYAAYGAFLSRVEAHAPHPPDSRPLSVH